MNVDSKSAALAERLAALSPAQRAFVENRLARASSVTDPELIVRRSDSGTAPLSFAQALLWTIEQTADGGSTYSVPRALRIEGALDEERLRAALDQLVIRHETLRTTYTVRDGEPVQIVGSARPVELGRVDLSALPEVERERALADALRTAASEPFDLTRGLLLRAMLVRLDRDEHALLLVSHHVASDEGSAGILFRDLAHAYDSQCGEPQRDLAVRYVDFAAWQRNFWKGERLDALVAHWRAALQGAPDVLDLPLDRPRPALPDFSGARRSHMVSSTLADGIAQFARSRGTTVFVTLLAAFQTLLHRYARQDDFVVGSVFSGRARPELDGVLGVFSNVLPLRAQFAGDPTFAQFLASAHERYLDAAEHCGVPFDRIVLELSERGVTDVPRAFQTMFSLAAGGPAVPQLGTLSIEPIEIDRGIARVDLGVAAAQTASGLQLRAEYRTQLFDAGTIERMLANFATLLASIVTDPDCPVSQLPLLSAPERALVQSEQRSVPMPYQRDATLQSLLTAQARRSPGAVALEAEGAGGALVRLSYAQLDARAESLAARLRALGVGRGIGVGVCADRSCEAIVAFLGVLKSGGYYVPLDPDYPAERIEFMLRDSGVPVLLTLARLRAAGVEFATPSGVRVVHLDSDEHVSAHPDASLPALAQQAATADDPAYVIYTSGSTGVPKGVMIRHRALVNFLTSMAREPGLGADDAVLAVTTFSFDIAGLEIWLPLLTGARLILATRATAVDGRMLAERLATSGATLLQATPSTWRLLLAAGWNGDAKLTMLCGGEALPPDLAADLGPRGRALWNMYGPTETTIWSALWRVRAHETISLGAAVANTHLYVLESGGEPAPFGVAGELCIGGDGVALGYLGRAELTDERFVPDPFDPSGAGRMYRTGDLVRRTADGRLEYLGRLDTQVKLRGFRIELGEIAAALTALPGVRQAVAALREDVLGDPRLIAYLASESPLDEDALRARLRAALPAYMVPSAFVRLDALPLTANGKIDRKALPAPDTANAPPRAVTPPRTPSERAVLRPFLDVLRCDAAGIDEDFFELGGHSLLAMRLLDRIAATLHVRLSLRSFFDAPTVAALAARVDAASSDAAAIVASSELLAPAVGPVPLTAAQETLWTLQCAMPENAAYNMRVGRRLSGRLDVAALRKSLDALVVRHPALRTTVDASEGAPRQLVVDPSPVQCDTVDLSALPHIEREREAERLVAEFGRRSFDLSRDVLLRALLVNVASDEHIFLLVSHHMVTDGASVGILLRDLSTLYAAEIARVPAALNALELTFADFAALARERTSAERHDENSAFWRDALHGTTSTLALPFDRFPGRTTSFAGARDVSIFPLELLEGVRLLAKREKTTPFVVLLASYATVLHRLTAQDDVVVGSPVDGRNAPGFADVVGYFVHTVPIVARFAGDPSFRALVAQLKDATFAAYEHLPVPSELTDGAATAGERAAPAFSTAFTYAVEDDVTRLGTLVSSPLEFATGTAKMDLALGIGARPEGLRVAFEYRTDAFDPSTVHRFAELLRHVLEEAVRDADRPVSALRLLAPDERQRILVDFNPRAAVSYPRDATVPELFGEQVAASPDAVAVTQNSESLTYRELDERANRLAHYLQRAGVTGGMPVGVYVRRSFDMVVAVLAVLKAGAHYVPLDPSYPPERLNFIARDTGMTLVLTQAEFAQTVPAVPTVVALDRLRAEVASEPASAPPASIGAESCAYIMYTSGSTGQPKGVEIPHRGIVRLVRNTNYANFGVDEAVLCFASLAFDASTFELWAPLLNGGRLVLAGPDSLALDDLGAVLRAQRVTTLLLTAALFHEMIERDVEAFRGVRRLLAGGEALSVPHVTR
ncbi:MAG: amino acid adenylation domain-containing protein, partial [Candidatus Eremiobacteraeota bacterium]|nr:amino acid adenylation domain-containing protein [Candidatus Eremiobacteraeota bacterium]